MRERPLSAKLRVVNDDAGFEDGGVDGLKKEAKKGAKKEAKKGANKEAKKEVKKEAKKEVKKEAKKEDEEREEGEEEEQSLEEVRVLYTAWMSIDFSAEGY